MKSRISIDVDYDNQPVIKIEYRESDDVRDKLVKKFLETFGHASNTARVEWLISPPEGQDVKIRPVAPMTFGYTTTVYPQTGFVYTNNQTSTTSTDATTGSETTR